MAEVVQFVSAKERELRALAEEIIEELGPEAGLRLGRLARSPALSEHSRERLLAVAEIIEREQEHGWYFPGDEDRGLILGSDWVEQRFPMPPCPSGLIAQARTRLQDRRPRPSETRADP